MSDTAVAYLCVTALLLFLAWLAGFSRKRRLPPRTRVRQNLSVRNPRR